MPRRKLPRIPDAILDQLLAGADAKFAFDRRSEPLRPPIAQRPGTATRLRAQAQRAPRTSEADGFGNGGNRPRWRGAEVMVPVLG